MADNRTRESRSALMSRIGSKNTAPEITVRKLLHSMGFRFRLHRKDLPGTPDIVLPARRKAIFVNGCFWHSHGCRIGQPPKTRSEYWGPKLARNRERDGEKTAALREEGWDILTLWQCEIKDRTRLAEQLHRFLG
ncbi:MAG: DNA mismatch endonuclease Vsr [Alphaproteobacteria bacterium]|nr:MAG: DNA mismatch endonuclease Vsr [Alphaproteobacteria bacterium]